jgi:ankyrin repeat protein
MEEEKLTPNFEDDTVRALYEATINGNISALKTLNPLTLSKVSFSPFGENPLHIASLFGYLDLCVVILEVNPSLASKVDSKGRYPLHLASAEGHIDIVKTLLMENQDICLIPDKDHKLPIHLAVSGGHVEVIEELKNATPCSIQNISDDGSILHLCVRYNHLEALKYIVLSMSGAQELLHVQDKEGNTILHWAVNLKQIKVFNQSVFFWLLSNESLHL